MRLGLIACRVLWRELSYFAAQSEHVIEYHFLPQGLHVDPERMRGRIQAAINELDGENLDYIILGYGLCQRGIEGIRASRHPLVVPRAHDCLTFFLGSRERHEDMTARNPGAYWFSPGWIETGTQPGRERFEIREKSLRESFGDENAEYLMEILEGWRKRYNKAIYVDLGVGEREVSIAYTGKCAAEMGWEMETVQGDAELVRSLVGGDWKEDSFLVVPPGREIKATADKGLIGLK